MLCWPILFDSFLIFDFFLTTFECFLYLRRHSADETDRSAHSGSSDSVMKLDFLLVPGGFPLDAHRNFERKLRI